MWATLSETVRRSWVAKLSLVFFLGMTIWWLTIYTRGLTKGNENNAFTTIYPWLSLLGGISGIVISKKWGGLKSVLGRSIFLLSCGLLAQSFGQAVYTYYIYIQGIEVPYPSWGDLGYFGSILFYIYGVWLLARATGTRLSLKLFKGQALALFVPLLLLAISYLIFLRSYEFDLSAPLKIFLDFGYPLGQAIYVSIAILTFLLSRRVLGGMMRGPLLFLLLALVAQYISDFTFLYQVNKEQWYVGGVNDYMYLVSYLLMTIGLIQLGVIFKRIRES